MTFPFVCNVPIALGLGRPSVFLRKALLALAAAFLRKTGCSLSVDLRFKVRLPAASIGAKCFSVVSLHANGREDSLAAKTWLICGRRGCGHIIIMILAFGCLQYYLKVLHRTLNIVVDDKDLSRESLFECEKRYHHDANSRTIHCILCQQSERMNIHELP